MKKLILGIETSCDDTSLCVLRGTPLRFLPADKPEVLSLSSFSQEKFLKKWGGVVPEIAARNHMIKLPPLVDYVLNEADITLEQIDLIAVTTHPGLLGPLLTGLNTAKTLAMYQELPLHAVNHLYAHLEAIHLTQEINYPYLGLLVSGGHSLYCLVTAPDKFEILGGTTDDAAGEAFDKGGKLMGLPYPAGRYIDQFAKEGNPFHVKFPIGLEHSKNAQLSFSGLKTSLKNYLNDHPDLNTHEVTEATKELKHVCAAYQKAIVDALSLKLEFACELAKKKTGKDLPIVVGGGVACNSGLRKNLQKKFAASFFVEPVYCTDNAAMIANYALRTIDNAIPFPKCLQLDAHGRFINKEGLIHGQAT